MQARFVNAIPLAADQGSEKALLCLREPRHIRVLGNVGTVPLVALVRYVEPNFV